MRGSSEDSASPVPGLDPRIDPAVHLFSCGLRERRGGADQIRPRSGKAGFTLLEVLVALVIVGMAVGGVASVFSMGLVGHETAAGAETALALAEEQLAVAGAALHPGAASGIYLGRFAWRTTTALYEDGGKAADEPTGLPQLYRVAVSVAWHDGHRGRELSLSTLRLGAAPP